MAEQLGGGIARDNVSLRQQEVLQNHYQHLGKLEVLQNHYQHLGKISVDIYILERGGQE